ncbi:MAG: hypothetical protein OER80_01420 [Gammaproteobacteria bacterium]|nr:hypothetical protein [Gammaproteobacteria bacterium]MDH3767058.1 hypothetical protein [Gammaproteobacteria bacterium]
MTDKHRKIDQTANDSVRDWHPYKVWQKHIKDAETQPDEQDQNPTGSWRTDAVWQNLIKG